MRDIVVVGIVLAILPFVLRHSWIGVILWTWISIMNPHKLTYGFAYDAPLAAVVAGTVIVSLATTRDKLRMPWASPVVVLFLFVFWMCLTTITAIDPAGSWDQLNKVLKIQLMTAVALLALNERKHIEYFVWINVLSVAYFGFKGGIFTILTGGAARVWGPPGGFFAENNSCAVAIIMVIPLINFLRTISASPLMRFGLLVLMVTCTAAALGSQSRGALLAIFSMGLLLWYRSDRKSVSALVIILVATALVAFMPESWEERMSTIQTYDADRSAMGRLTAWQFCFNLANHRFMGGGFDIYNWANYAIYAPPDAVNAWVAHSIYFSVLGEHGYVGLILFLLIWGLTFRMAGQMRKEAKNQPNLAWVYHLAGMSQASLVGYLAGASFLSLAYFDLPYNILVILVVTRRWMRASGSAQEGAGALGPSAVAPSGARPQALT